MRLRGEVTLHSASSFPTPAPATGTAVLPSETQYVRQADSLLEKIRVAELNLPADYPSFVDRKSTIEQAISDYQAVYVPPSCTKADSMIREGFSEERLALTYFDICLKSKGTSLGDQAQRHWDNAGKIFIGAAQEMQRVLESSAKSP